MSKHLSTAAPAALLLWLLRSAVGKNRRAKIGLGMENEATVSQIPFSEIVGKVAKQS